MQVNRISWIALYVNGDNVTYFDNFVIELIPKEIKKITSKNYILRNIYTIQPNDLTICRYFYIEFIVIILIDTSFLDYTNLFPPKEYEKNHKIVLEYFQ